MRRNIVTLFFTAFYCFFNSYAQVEKIMNRIEAESSNLNNGQTEIYDAFNSALYVFSATYPNGLIVGQKLGLNWSSSEQYIQYENADFEQKVLLQPVCEHPRPNMRDNLSIVKSGNDIYLCGAVHLYNSKSKFFSQKIDEELIRDLKVDTRDFKIIELNRNIEYPLEGIGDDYGNYYFGTYPDASLYKINISTMGLSLPLESSGEEGEKLYCRNLKYLKGDNSTKDNIVAALVNEEKVKDLIIHKYSNQAERTYKINFNHIEIGDVPVTNIRSYALKYDESNIPWVYCLVEFNSVKRVIGIELTDYNLNNTTVEIGNVTDMPENNQLDGELIFNAKGLLYIVGSVVWKVDLKKNNVSYIFYNNNQFKFRRIRCLSDGSINNRVLSNSYSYLGNKSGTCTYIWDTMAFPSEEFKAFNFKTKIEGGNTNFTHYFQIPGKIEPYHITYSGGDGINELTDKYSRGGEKVKGMAIINNNIFFTSNKRFKSMALSDGSIYQGVTHEEVHSICSYGDSYVFVGKYWGPILQSFKFEENEPIPESEIFFNSYTYKGNNISPRIRAMTTDGKNIYFGTTPSVYNAYAFSYYRGFLMRYNPTNKSEKILGLVKTPDGEGFEEGIECLQYFEQNNEKYLFGGTGDNSILFQFLITESDNEVQEIEPIIVFDDYLLKDLTFIKLNNKNYLCGLLSNNTNTKIFLVEIRPDVGIKDAQIYTKEIEGFSQHLESYNNHLLLQKGNTQLFYIKVIEKDGTLSINVAKYLGSFPQTISEERNAVLVDNNYLYAGSSACVENGKNGQGGNIYRIKLDLLNQVNLQQSVISSFGDKSIYKSENGLNIASNSIYKNEECEITKMIVGDFDGDGDDELLTKFDCNNNIYKSEDAEKGAIAVNSIYDGDCNLEQWITGDFDGDGDDELLTKFDCNNNIYKSEDAEEGAIAVNSIYDGDCNLEQWITGDFDGDGDDELLTKFDCNNNIYKSEDVEEGAIAVNSIYDGDCSLEQWITGDFDGNGDDELLIKFDCNNVIYRSEDAGEGTIGIKSIYEGDCKLEQWITGDFDGDGDDELLTKFDCNDIIYRSENADKGTVGSVIVYDGTCALERWVVGDFDSDGDDEILLKYEETNTVYFSKDASSGSFDNLSSYNGNEVLKEWVVGRLTPNLNYKTAIEFSTERLGGTLRNPVERTIVVRPNPFTDFIFFPDSQFKTIWIYNQIGELVYQGKIKAKINLEHLPEGLYYMHLKQETGSIIQKIIKVN